MEAWEEESEVAWEVAWEEVWAVVVQKITEVSQR